MMNLESFLTNGIFAFILTFVRVGTVIMVMPGIGDSFTPTQVRLYIALGLSLVLFPLILPLIPSPVPGGVELVGLLVMEFVIGTFIGMVSRILMTALDTGGMIISMQSGLGNAQLFNPLAATQGSLIGTFFSITGMLVFMVTGMYRLIFMGIVGSYQMFPVGSMPNTGDMSNLVIGAVAASFSIGIQIAGPFIIVGMVLYIGMGILTRLMPQVQMFMIAMPLQIALAFITVAIVLSASVMFWAEKYQDGMTYFLRASGG